jgi:lipopolysaccharide export system permease protein
LSLGFLSLGKSVQTLHRYVTTSFVFAFLMTLVIFTFILCIGLLFKITELLVLGVSWRPILTVFLWGIPGALTLSIPVSLMTGGLLVFGRLSADGEITAMKASGVKMADVVSCPLLFSIAMMSVCLYLNGEVTPRGHMARAQVVTQLKIAAKANLIEEGRQEFPGITAYIGRKRGQELSDIRIYDARTKGVRREIVAKTGRIRPSAGTPDLVIDLFDVRVDPFYDDRKGMASCKKWAVRIADAPKKRRSGWREDDMSFADLVDGIRHADEYYPDLAGLALERQRMKLSVELHKRLALSCACFTFVLLGIPLGIKAHRRESSIGVAVSLVLMFVFYLFVLAAESLYKRPEVRADLIVWIPVLLAAGLGCRLLQRAN